MQILIITASGLVLAASSCFGFFVGFMEGATVIMALAFVGFVLGGVVGVSGCVRLLVHVFRSAFGK